MWHPREQDLGRDAQELAEEVMILARGPRILTASAWVSGNQPKVLKLWRPQTSHVWGIKPQSQLGGLLRGTGLESTAALWYLV